MSEAFFWRPTRTTSRPPRSASRGRIRPPANDLQAALYGQLAEWGDFQALAVVSSAPRQAIVSAHIRFPNNGHAHFQELVAAALLQELSILHDSGQLQFFEDDVCFDLVLEANQWRIEKHWGQSITVQLEAVVSPNLPWDFYPVQDEIAALPGELVRATYFARFKSIPPQAIPPGAAPSAP